MAEHVRPRQLGTVLAAETGFLLARDPDTVRAADVAFVRCGRAAPPTRGYFPGPPDLAVEVLSPGDQPSDVDETVAAWIEARTRAVWVVDPHMRTVALHEPGRAPRVVAEVDTLRGGTVLPGFELAVREIFA
ncbi:MAG: Uma2 family endonuclease [Planctomycetota bacterium]